MNFSEFMPDLVSMTPEQRAEWNAELGPDELNVLEGDSMLDAMQLARRERAEMAAYEFAKVDQFRRHREECSAGQADPSGLFARALRAELAAGLKITEDAAAALLARARILAEDLPTTLWRLGGGLFSEQHAVIIADAAAGLTADQLREFEQRVLPWAERLTTGKFWSKARQLKELIRAADMEQRHQEARENREVYVDSGQNGMGWLTAYLPNAQIE